MTLSAQDTKAKIIRAPGYPVTLMRGPITRFTTKLLAGIMAVTDAMAKPLWEELDLSLLLSVDSLNFCWTCLSDSMKEMV